METLCVALRRSAHVLWLGRDVFGPALLCLGLGVGAVTALFPVASAAFLRPLPFRNGSELFLLSGVTHPAGAVDPTPWFAKSGLLTRVRMVKFGKALARISGRTHPTQVAVVAPDWFDFIGTGLVAGMGFQRAGNAGEIADGAVISESLWTAQFGRSAEALGQTLIVANEALTITGIVRDDTAYPPKTAIWLPQHRLASDAQTVFSGGSYRAEILGQALRGVRPKDLFPVVQAAQRSIEALERVSSSEVTVVPLREHILGSRRPILLALSGAAAAVLLIAFANVFLLFLTWSLDRQESAFVRASLGATVHHFVADAAGLGLAFGVLGSVVGGTLGVWGFRYLRALAPPGLLLSESGSGTTTTLVAAVLVATTLGIAVAVVTASVAFTGLPARRPLPSLLRSTPPPGRRRVRAIIVSFQMASALVLALVTAQSVRALHYLMALDSGVRTDDLVVASVMTRGSLSDEAGSFARIADDAVMRLEAVPDFERAAVSDTLPMFGPHARKWIAPVRSAEGRGGTVAVVASVSPAYFATAGIGLWQGRTFGVSGTRAEPNAVIVDRRTAKRFWPGGAIGEFLRVGGKECQVVGIVENVRGSTLEARPTHWIYVPLGASVANHYFILARFARTDGGALRAVEETLSRIFGATAAVEAQMMNAVVHAEAEDARYKTLLLTVISVVAVLLTVAGCYGIAAYASRRRLHELAIRHALGASRASVMGCLFKDSLLVVGSGVVVGLLLSRMTWTVASPLLHGVRAVRWVDVLMVALLGSIALFASYVPARQAARPDLAALLRQE